MKKAELAAQNGTPLDMLPDVGVEASASHHPIKGQDVPAGDQYAVHSMEQEFEDSNKQGKLRNFIVPMLMLIGFTIYFDIDVLKGLLVTLVLTLAFYSYQRLMPLGEMMEVMMNGFKTMLPAICTVIAAFIFKDVCDKLLLPQYVIENLTPYMTAQMLPAIVFLAMAILSFATGSSWGIFAVSIPIVMPLAYAVEADIPLVIGALLSASSFGSQACFYSDSTVLAAQGSGCNLVSHAMTQLPYTLIAASLAFIGFILIA
jgi:Na+/H+ antiporter NhaC